MSLNLPSVIVCEYVQYIYGDELRNTHNGWNAVEVRRYAEGTHDMIAPALKCDEIVGNAVATTVESRQETRIHNDRPAKTATTFLKGRRFV